MSFNIGITVGPWLGGLAIEAGMGYSSVAWIGAVLGVVALGLVGLSRSVTTVPRSLNAEAPEAVSAHS